MIGGVQNRTQKMNNNFSIMSFNALFQISKYTC